jgi:membrane associated rhomboid family serine protease
MLPIGDDNSDRHLTPYVNYLLILLNILVFIFYQGLGTNMAFTFAYATVPAEILTGHDIITEPQIIHDQLTGLDQRMPGLQATPVPVYLTLFTSMFMHGGFAHLFGNLLYLWVFGDNLENVMGHGRYLAFYLLCGLLASLAHVFSTAYLGQDPLIPSLGASGAISGVLGGYLLLFPGRHVRIWLFFIFTIMVPAIVVLGLWIFFQIVNGMGMLGGEETAGGVAYAAHIGGFIAGLLLVKLFVNPILPAQQLEKRLPQQRKTFY